ncbi:MAG: chromosomal replication initiator protein DnaA [Treponema sp.]|nr:chromosomal replication initiator protein DnaA [Treponema sp.]
MAEQNYKDFFEEAMNQIREELKSSGKENEFILNFNISYIEDTISEIKVNVASKFMWDRMIQKGNISKIESKINELTGQIITLSPVINLKPTEVSSSVSSSPESEKPFLKSENSENQSSDIFLNSSSQNQFNSHPQLIEDYTFENFVPGDNSQYAYSACLAAAKSPGHKNYNPILLYGPSGVGKTHLMVSIGNYIYSKNPSTKISYITTESLMNEFTAALRQHTTEKFTKKYRKLDVLLLDDIQFLEKSEKLQDELFYTFDEIYNRKGQIVFTSDRPVSEIKGIVERLRTRFARGQNIDLKIPDYETRLAIIDKKLEIQGKSISQEVKEFIAKSFQSNVREIEGALGTMISYAELMNKELTLDIAMEQLGSSINSSGLSIITLETIQKVVSDFYNISIDDLKSSSRKKTVAVPRHIAIYLSRVLTEYSLSEIGEEFGGRDHSTVLSSYDNIDKRIKTGDMAISDIINALTKQIKNSI